MRNGAPTRGSRPRGCAGLQNAASKKEATTLTRATGLGVLLAFGICLVAAWADGFAPGAPEQWIAPLPDDLNVPMWGWTERHRARWVIWPSDTYIAARQPPTDRAGPPPDEREAKRARRIEPLSAARADALWWLRTMLRPEFVPDDPDAQLVLLQEEDPRASSVVSRVEAHGTHVQVQQFRWALCVVIKPDPALVHGLAPEAIGPAVFRAVFSKGDQMAVADAIAVPGAPAGTTVYRGAAVPGRLWWQWQLWYTDGSAVGLYMVKYDGGQLTVGADDPWF